MAAYFDCHLLHYLYLVPYWFSFSSKPPYFPFGDVKHQETSGWVFLLWPYHKFWTRRFIESFTTYIFSFALDRRWSFRFLILHAAFLPFVSLPLSTFRLSLLFKALSIFFRRFPVFSFLENTFFGFVSLSEWKFQFWRLGFVLTFIV